MRLPLTGVDLQRLSSCGTAVALIVGVCAHAVARDGRGVSEHGHELHGKCGSTFAVPGWTDAGGWTDPSQYSTIRLADVNGDGSDELLGRNSDGIEVFEFDTSVGQWRPQVDGNGVRQLVSWTDANNNVVSDFASPSLSNESDPHRITGAAVLLHHPGRQHRRPARGRDTGPLLGRDARLQVLPAHRHESIDGGTWKRIGALGPFSDAEG